MEEKEMKEKLEIITLKLFQWNYYDDSEYTDEIDDECRDIVEATIEQFGCRMFGNLGIAS